MTWNGNFITGNYKIEQGFIKNNNTSVCTCNISVLCVQSQRPNLLLLTYQSSPVISSKRHYLKENSFIHAAAAGFVVNVGQQSGRTVADASPRLKIARKYIYSRPFRGSNTT